MFGGYWWLGDMWQWMVCISDTQLIRSIVSSVYVVLPLVYVKIRTALSVIRKNIRLIRLIHICFTMRRYFFSYPKTLWRIILRLPQLPQHSYVTSRCWVLMQRIADWIFALYETGEQLYISIYLYLCYVYSESDMISTYTWYGFLSIVITVTIFQ